MDGDAHGHAPSFVLAIDTSLGACSACCLAPGATEPAAAESVIMARGHAEALVPLVDRVVSRIEGGFGALRRVAVTVGPGSFTGIRVGVSAARAFGLACKVPVVGVSTLAALAAPSIGTAHRATIVAAIDAHHGNVYLQSFAPDGDTRIEACVLPVPEALRALGRGPLRLIGSGAPLLAIEAWSQGLDAEVDERAMAPDIAYVARLGLLADATRALPRPLYLKAPDAQPQANGVLARAD